AASSRPIMSSGKRTLSRMLAQGSSVGAWKTMPVSSRGSVTLAPPIDTLPPVGARSEEHTSELQSPCNLVCRLLLEKKKNQHRSLLYSRTGSVSQQRKHGMIQKQKSLHHISLVWSFCGFLGSQVSQCPLLQTVPIS